jgi:hypothetical protein
MPKLVDFVYSAGMMNCLPNGATCRNNQNPDRAFAATGKEIADMDKSGKPELKHTTAVVAAILICCWGILGTASAVAESESFSSAAVTSDNQVNEEPLIITEIEGQVDREILIPLELSPFPPPAGSFYTTVVDVMESPEGAKPEILPGVPEISVRCPKAGIYRLIVRANLIQKSSCALANAQILNEQEVHLIISP